MISAGASSSSERTPRNGQLVTPTSLEHAPATAPTRRLWRPLSYRPVRPKELKDLDKSGDRFIGSIMRRIRSQQALRRWAGLVIEASEKMRLLSEQALNERIEEARDAARRGRRDPQVRVMQFAVVREVIRRTRGLSLYPEQVMGGWAMEDGGLAEMLTGEGKTVTACLAAAVQGWMGYGTHVVTVNDYLAKRDAEQNAPIYQRLGLSVGVIQESSAPPERLEAYARDVTYTSDQQLIFDYLRDRLRSPLQPRLSSLLLEELTDTDLTGRRPIWCEHVVQRGLYAAIVDEADSVLIDQATTPAVIGQDGQKDAAAEYYHVAADLARGLQRGRDYLVDVSQHLVELTESGRAALEAQAGRLPPFWSGPRRREELVTQALVAKELFHLHDHYIIRDGDVQIVDSHTGRVLEGRQWQLGLHQAVQAKEGLEITAPRQTLARMSYQRFFQSYRRLAGMTGTAWEVRHEIWRTYRMPVVRIPPHRPVIREQRPDRVFLDQSRKFEAVADRVASFHRQGRPVLVGTRSVEASERLSALLEARNLPHRVLNAKRHEEEAAIVALAGRRGAITVATNMAGRGTDILLGAGVAKLGGLVVIATERHDSRRIDRQLFGRSGRQGDPGLAEVYVSLDDPLIEKAGLRWLTHLCRRSALARRLGAAKVLWWHAQRAASRRQAATREMIGNFDLWFDRALHFENR